jgi:transposase
MFLRTKKRSGQVYLQLVESKWVNGKVRQQFLKSLGRLDKLQATGELDGLLRSGAKFSERLAVLDAHDQGKSIATKTAKIGPALIFEKLWRESGISHVLEKLLTERRFEFSVERAIFMTVLHRLVAPGSDRAAEKWKADYGIEGAEGIHLHHLYRAMGWLGEALANEDQKEATPLSPRCVKDQIEEALFTSKRDLFTGLELVFFDTTSIYFEGEGGDSIGQYGKSKDHRSDLKQMVVGVVLDDRGHPICSEFWPGNAADVKSLVPIAKRLEARFHIERICLVADRGMISEDTMEEIKKMKWQYILGAKMRKMKEVKDMVLSRGGRYEEVYPKSRDPKAPSPLKVKEVVVGKNRYAVCFNQDQAVKDRHDRETILEALKKALKKGDKSLVGNKGYRRFVKTQKGHFEIDQAKAKAEERYDGKWVLATNTDLSARDLALKYKQLLMVEDIFRSMKSLLETRPIYHKCDETIRGHVFCSFLALILRKQLQDLLDEKGWHTLQWADVIHDLDQLMETEIQLSEKEYRLRSETKGTTGKVFQAVGVAMPPKLIQK